MAPILGVSGIPQHSFFVILTSGRLVDGKLRKKSLQIAMMRGPEGRSPKREPSPEESV
jgi:hypothetical protein